MIIFAVSGEAILVSRKDYYWLRKFRWFIVHRGHKQKVATRIKGQDGKWRWFYMHRMITKAPPGVQVDHRRGNGLDNRRSKLRVCTPAQNCQAYRRAKDDRFLSRYRGVTFAKQEGKWMAQIRFHLGYFKSEVKAAKAYDKAAKRLYGRFASPNFP